MSVLVVATKLLISFFNFLKKILFGINLMCLNLVETIKSIELSRYGFN